MTERKGLTTLRPDQPDVFAQQCFELFIEPELERRRNAGVLSDAFQLLAVQVVFHAGGPAEVRFNEEVNGHAEVRASRGFDRGEEVTFDDLEEIEGFTLTDEEPDAAHITMFRLRSGWTIHADFRFNATRVANHTAAAQEFLDSAAENVSQGRLRPFVEDIFAAVELMATCELLFIADQDVLRSRRSRHRHVSSQYNRMGKFGTVEQRFVRLHNRADGLRRSARYLHASLSLGEEEAREMLGTAREMMETLRAKTPGRPHIEPSDTELDDASDSEQ